MTKEGVMLKEEVAQAGIKSTIGLAGAFFSSLSLNDWVAILTIVYLTLQIILLIPKYLAWYRSKHPAKKQIEPPKEPCDD